VPEAAAPVTWSFLVKQAAPVGCQLIAHVAMLPGPETPGRE